MGTVQVNEKLIDRTRSAIDRFHNQEKTRAEREFLNHLPAYGDEIYEQLVGPEFLGWCRTGPKGMLKTSENLLITSLGDHPINLTLPMMRPPYSPNERTQFASGSMERGYKALSLRLDGEHPHWLHLVTAAQVLTERRAKLEQDKSRLRRFTRAVLLENKTLGPALRMWPALWDLLDSDDRRRQGAKPKGMQTSVPYRIGDEGVVREMTGMVMRIKLLGA